MPADRRLSGAPRRHAPVVQLAETGDLKSLQVRVRVPAGAPLTRCLWPGTSGGWGITATLESAVSALHPQSTPGAPEQRSSQRCRESRSPDLRLPDPGAARDPVPRQRVRRDLTAVQRPSVVDRERARRRWLHRRRRREHAQRVHRGRPGRPRRRLRGRVPVRPGPLMRSPAWSSTGTAWAPSRRCSRSQSGASPVSSRPRSACRCSGSRTTTRTRTSPAQFAPPTDSVGQQRLRGQDGGPRPGTHGTHRVPKRRDIRRHRPRRRGGGPDGERGRVRHAPRRHERPDGRPRRAGFRPEQSRPPRRRSWRISTPPSGGSSGPEDSPQYRRVLVCDLSGRAHRLQVELVLRKQLRLAVLLSEVQQSLNIRHGPKVPRREPIRSAFCAPQSGASEGLFVVLGTVRGAW